MRIMEKDHRVVILDISKRFGVKEMLSDKSNDNRFLVSFLYYFGILTIAGETSDGKLALKVPNLVMQGLYVERIQRMLLPEPQERDEGRWAAEKVYEKGDIEPLCKFMEERYFKVFANRDYRWANELTVKTAFLSLLYNDIIFIMDSEKELERKYADLSMIIRPDKRHLTVFDVLIEFKFVSLKDLGMSAQKIKKMSKDELLRFPLVQKKLKEAESQVNKYGDSLEARHGNLKLKKFVIVALGFERLAYSSLNRT